MVDKNKLFDNITTIYITFTNTYQERRVQRLNQSHFFKKKRLLRWFIERSFNSNVKMVSVKVSYNLTNSHDLFLLKKLRFCF